MSLLSRTVLPSLKNRIYLTDATPDNIVVDATTFDVTFVDLDNVFLVDAESLTNDRTTHRHEKIDCDGMCFAYVPEELCSYHLSDINLFAICQVVIHWFQKKSLTLTLLHL